MAMVDTALIMVIPVATMLRLHAIIRGRRVITTGLLISQVMGLAMAGSKARAGAGTGRDYRRVAQMN